MDDLKLLEYIEIERNSLQTDRMDMSFGEIMSMYEKGEIIIDPSYQRFFRWTVNQQTRFIESIILGIPIPPIFVAEDENGRWELVDGLQRISTVLSFFGLLRNIDAKLSNYIKNRWDMSDCDILTNIKGYSVQTFPMKIINNIKRAVCRIEIIKWNSKIDMRYELFNRLNTGGSALTDQEIRNCIFRGTSDKINNFLKKIANNDRYLILIEPTDKQYQELYHEELVLRFFSLFYAIDELKGNMSKHMTQYMRSVITSDDFDLCSNEELFMTIIDILAKLKSSEIFRSVNGIFSTSLYDSIMLGIAYNIDKYKDNTKLLKEKINYLKHDKKFHEYTGSAASSESRVKKRIEISNGIFNN